MRKLFLSAAAALVLTSCGGNDLTITVINDSDIAAAGEIAGVPLADLPGFGPGRPMKLTAGGSEVPCQITYDSLLIFPAPVDTAVYGRLFPERKDDMAWSKGGIADMEAWRRTLDAFRTRIDNPLRIEISKK